jgi:hypothetical protein
VKRAAALLLLAPAAVLLAGADKRVAYRLPTEPQVRMPPGADAELAAGTCAACHSLDYIRHQPPNMGRVFWNTEVAKMRDAYGAEIDDADAQRIAAYLAGEAK